MRPREIKTIAVDNWGDTWINGSRVDGHGKPIRFNHRNRSRDPGGVPRKVILRNRRIERAAADRAWRRAWEDVCRRGAKVRRRSLADAAWDHAIKPDQSPRNQYKRCFAGALPTYWSWRSIPDFHRFFWERVGQSPGSEIEAKLCLHCDGFGEGKLRSDDCGHDYPF